MFYCADSRLTHPQSGAEPVWPSQTSAVSLEPLIPLTSPQPLHTRSMDPREGHKPCWELFDFLTRRICAAADSTCSPLLGMHNNICSLSFCFPHSRYFKERPIGDGDWRSFSVGVLAIRCAVSASLRLSEAAAAAALPGLRSMSRDRQLGQSPLRSKTSQWRTCSHAYCVAERTVWWCRGR